MSTDQIVAEIQAAYLRLKQAEATARYHYEHYLDGLTANFAQRRSELESSFAQAKEEAEATYQARVDDTRSTSGQGLDQFRTHLTDITAAFPWGVASWGEPWWQSYSPVANAPSPSCVRVGHLDLADAAELPEVPALARFAGHGHVFIACDDDSAASARDLLQSILLRLVVSTVPGSLHLTLVDPLGQGQNLATFLRLPAALRGEKVFWDPAELEQQLGRLAGQIETVIQTQLTNVYATIEEFNRATTGVAVPYRVLALADFPAGFSDRMAELLLRIARNGPRAGVYIVATINAGYQLPRQFDELPTLLRLGTKLRFTASDRLNWDDPEFGEHQIEPDSMPSSNDANMWLEAIGGASQQATIDLPFSRIAIPPADRWKSSTLEGVRVTIGVNSEGRPHDLTLGSGLVHHGLIGGDTQSGKTNLLHVLITQLALRYPPEELELYLIDFKEVEFQNYLSFGLPHARAVALESDREFGLSVLRRFRQEIDARAELFRQAGVARLSDFRRQTGRVLPRVLAVMDEFQVLFRDDDRVSTEAASLLEDVARRGAAFGLHVLLASQSPGGGRATVYLRHIYEQMALRIALRCQQPMVSQAILGEGNDAATRLTRAGEAVYNDRGGDKTHNPVIRIAELPNAERRSHLEAIRALAGDRSYPAPATFESRMPARLERNPEFQALLAQPGWPSAGPSVQAWLGEPIEIKPATSATFERYLRSNLLIVGDEEPAHGLLLATLLSLAAQRAPSDASFVVAEFARPTSPFAGFFARVKGQLPHDLEIAGSRAAGDALNRLLADLDARLAAPGASAPDRYFLVAGLHRWMELQAEGQYGQQSEAAKRLTRLADEGPELGIHVIAWVDGFTTLERVLKRAGLSAFDMRAVLRVAEGDSTNLLGTPAAGRLEDNRALFRYADWEAGRVEKFKPYASLEATALATLIATMTSRQLAAD